MKTIAPAFALLVASSVLVIAGPEPIAASGKEMKQVAAPIVPECPRWAGFYVGGFGGYTHAASDVTLDLLQGFSGGLGGLDAPFVESAGSKDFDFDGGEAGGVIGYNFQLNNWVIGAEATGAKLWLRDSRIQHVNVAASGDDYTISTSLKTNYLFTVGPRIGYAFCRWLPYVTGGLAVGDVDFDQAFYIPVRGAFRAGDRVEDTRVGWTVGGGLEYALTDHWHLRGDYRYVDLDCAGVNHSIVFAQQGTFTARSEACLHEHHVTLGLTFQF